MSNRKGDEEAEGEGETLALVSLSAVAILIEPADLYV